jgi:ABC-type antimicrobial peptide transport system permease subunit
VVGVSGDTIDDWFSRRGVPTAFVPVAEAPSLSVCVVLRTNGDPAALAGAARAAVAAVDRAQPVFDAVTMRDALRIRTTGLRFIGGMMAAFGAIALGLAALGIYSVMAYHVAQRRHEMGIRLALGATGGDVLRLTLGQGARMSGLGIVIGLALGLALARVLESALFGVVAAEPWLFAAVAVTLAAIACLASVIPARFAAATDPLIALREA